MKPHELARALKIGDERQALRSALKSLKRKGLVVLVRKNRWALPQSEKVVVGTLSMHPDGFGFVSIPEPGMEDVFIPKRRTGTALHGDTVQVVLSRSQRKARSPGRRKAKRAEESEKGPSGHITQVLERRFTHLAGTLQKTPFYRYVIPDHPRILQNIHIQSCAKACEETPAGHRVVVELLPWEDTGAPIPGKLIEDLGPADAPGVDMVALLRSHGLDMDFPDEIEKASRSVAACRAPSQQPDRRDLREELCFTIDPEDARDFDDAVSLTRNTDGQWVLQVHIADVAAYVAPGDPIDREARERGNSVYLVDRVITMLPRHLTEKVCSLSPNEDRWAHTIKMTFSPRGKSLQVETFPSIIRSKARFNYEQVQAFLVDGQREDRPGTVYEMLSNMQKLAETLRRKRARSGSILFEMPEVRCVLNDAGETVDIVPRRAYVAYHLIEEFMLAANQAVARIIAQKGYPAVWRIHEPPDDEQWERIGHDLAALGIREPALTREDLNAIAEKVAGEPAAHIVNLAMLRNLKRAVYSAERADHFGLAFSHYLHFTSPIRRYADLIVHRVLKAIEQKVPPPYKANDIARIADQCSRTEREADEAEMQSVDLKRIEYYAAKLDAGDIGPYSALITSVTGRGLLVELRDTMQRGFVPFALIPRDHYQVNAQRNRATGRRTRHTWKIGDVLDVEITRVDKARKRVEFRPAPTRGKRAHD